MSDHPATAADVFRTKRPDALFDDVIVLWVESDADKLALVQDAWMSQASKRRAQQRLESRS